MTERRHIGKPFPLIEDRRFVRGRGRYINDLALPGMLHLAPAAAPVAHARIRGIDVAAALRVPGVVAVLTGKDLPALMEPVPQNLPLPDVHWYPLAVDKVRFAGEWVAAVLARDRATAEDAAELIEADYEELPAVIDPERALEPSAPLLHEAHETNIAWEGSFTWGQVDEAFAAATRQFRYRFRWHRHGGVPLETFGVLASVDPGHGRLEVWASHQTPGLAQQISHVLHWPSHRVRLHQDVDVGGSYGAKRGRKQVFLTAAAAIHCGRPVKFIEDRLEYMRAGDSHGPDRIFDIRLAADAEGRVAAIDLDLIDDVGAYVGRGPLQIAKPITAAIGPYRIGAVRYSGRAVMTNKTNQAPFRGFGQAPHNFVLERAVDLMAAELGLGPIEVRRRNYIGRDEFPYRTPTGSEYDSGDFPAVLDRALAASGHAQLLAQRDRARAEGRLVGVGLAGCLEPSGGNEAVFAYVSGQTMSMQPEGARVQVDLSGHVVVSIGFQSTGQGHESMVTQIVCEELGVEPLDVAVVRADSLGGVPSVATIASRMTLMLGSALVFACRKLRAKVDRIAAHQGRELSLAEAAVIAYRDQERLPADMEPGLVETAVVKVPGGGERIDAEGRLRRGYPSYAFSVHVVMAEVDPRTFEIRLPAYHVAHDCGTVINPLVVAGMVYGGIAHGVGAALLERFAYDENGQMVSASFMDYLLPTVAEMPDIRLTEVETPSPLHPYGAKGSGEGGYMTAPAAIASAIEDALRPLGVRVTELPVTPSGILDLVEK